MTHQNRDNLVKIRENLRSKIDPSNGPRPFLGIDFVDPVIVKSLVGYLSPCRLHRILMKRLKKLVSE